MPQNKKDVAAPKRKAQAKKPASPGAAAQSTAKRQRQVKVADAVPQTLPETPETASGTSPRPKRGRKIAPVANSPIDTPTPTPTGEISALPTGTEAPVKPARKTRRSAVPTALPESPDPSVDSA